MSRSCFIFSVGLEQADNTDSAGKEEIQLWPKRKKLKRWNRVKEKGERGLMTRKKPKVGKSLSYMYGWCAC